MPLVDVDPIDYAAIRAQVRSRNPSQVAEGLADALPALSPHDGGRVLAIGAGGLADEARAAMTGFGPEPESARLTTGRSRRARGPDAGDRCAEPWTRCTECRYHGTRVRMRPAAPAAPLTICPRYSAQPRGTQSGGYLDLLPPGRRREVLGVLAGLTVWPVRGGER
jgi:hypothetical protein